MVLIMADDLGYHDLGGYGHPKIKTPVLDRLAKRGVKLTAFYAGATVCTPSRMASISSRRCASVKRASHATLMAAVRRRRIAEKAGRLQIVAGFIALHACKL